MDFDEYLIREAQRALGTALQDKTYRTAELARQHEWLKLAGANHDILKKADRLLVAPELMRVYNLEIILRTVDAKMRVQADLWISTADIYAASGLYQEMAEVIAARDDDLIVDVGCAGGHLLEAIGKPAIGIDLNEYFLRHAETRFQDKGMHVNRYENFSLTIENERGLIPKPKQVRALEPRGITLYHDDARNFDVTAQLLSKRKATLVTCILINGIYAHHRFEYLADRQCRQQGIPRKDESEAYYILDAVVANAHKILAPDGRLIIGIREEEALASQIEGYLWSRYHGQFKETHQHILQTPYPHVDGGSLVGYTTALGSVAINTEDKAVLIEVKLK